MNFLKGILGIQKESNVDGKLSKSFTEQTYNGAMSRISQTQVTMVFDNCIVNFTEEDNVPYSYFIKCTNGNNKSKEYFFPISSNMNLERKVIEENKKQCTIISFDIDNKGNKIQLLFDTTLEGDEAEILIFQDSLCKLVYESVNHCSYQKSQSSQDYQKYINTVLPSNYPLQNSDIDLNKLGQQFEKHLNLNEPKPKQYDEEQKQEVPRQKIDLTAQLQNKSVLLAASGSFYSVNDDSKLRLINKDIIFTIKEIGDFHYYLSISNIQQQVIYQIAINSELSYFIDLNNNFIKWSDFSKDSFNLYSITYDAPSTGANLKFQIHQCIFQTNYKENFKDVLQQDDFDYTSKFFGESPAMEEEIVKQYSNEPDIEIDPQNLVSVISQSSQKYNKDESRIIEQAEVLDRTFLTKGSEIGVYRTDPQEKNRLDFICSLPLIKTLDGEEVNPKKIMLNEKDTKVLVLNKDVEEKVYQMDLETGKVVKEFLADEGGYNTIQDICPESKTSQAKGNPIFLSCNKRNIFLMDPRLAKSNVASIKKSDKIYAKDNGFTCIQSTQDGYFALGSNQGDIRLYKQIGQNAKNKFPGLGDPILSIDSTKDGKWLLATCKTYLILLPTFSDNTSNGYTNTLKTVDKRVPFKLQIHPQDLYKWKIKQIQFTAAKFDESKNNSEHYIITSIQNLLVLWSLKRVIQGYIYDYEIKQFKDNILNAEFKFNNPDNIFAALPNELCLQPTKFIKK